MVLLGHLPRRAIVMNEDGIPTLAGSDEPYHLFRAAAEAAGLLVRVLSDGGAGGGQAAQQQRPLLLALALDPAQLLRLPLPADQGR